MKTWVLLLILTTQVLVIPAAYIWLMCWWEFKANGFHVSPIAFGIGIAALAACSILAGLLVFKK